MNLRSVLKKALFLLLLYLAPSFYQIIAEVDVPELQLLASNLKPEECVKLVFLDSQTPLSKAQIQKLAREQSCFRRLVKWICQLRTVTRNTYPILNNLLERIGRKDLIACLAEFGTKSSKSPKVIRDVQAAEDSDDYEGVVATAPPKPEEKDSKTYSKTQNQSSDKVIEKIRHTAVNVSVQTAGIVIVLVILLTCCCTLFIRSKMANLLNRIRGKKKKGKLIAIGEEGDDVSKSYLIRKPRVKRKRAPSYEMVHTATQNTVVPVPKEPEEPPVTGCYKCYKKKRKKRAKQPHR
ncbi:PREDICTED: uncharacterized protein LOC108547472 [Eufriesea mexicana]|uniref:uncharacterized protein LOC108547472 n=1 Tax=Eufriesea mexicana TaxID=516756 RepID=UPI00083BC5E9|nr:PREDICTED: uncharacterized protein LOC108547472 [Eufriesea mexicana]